MRSNGNDISETSCRGAALHHHLRVSALMGGKNRRSNQGGTAMEDSVGSHQQESVLKPSDRGHDRQPEIECQKPRTAPGESMTTIALHNQLVSTKEASEILGRSPATLKRWRYEGDG